jgi:hypothetical protein
LSEGPGAGDWDLNLWFQSSQTHPAPPGGAPAAAVAVLIRPNLAPMVSFPVLWFVIEACRETRNRRRYVLHTAAFLAALLPGLLITAALNRFWNGSALRSGYGTVGDIFSLTNVLPNLGNYSVWLSQTQTPLAFLGIAALLVPVRWLWPWAARRTTVLVLGLFVAAVWAEYCAYLTFGSWWDLRFLLPASGFMMIGLAVILVRVAGLTAATGVLGSRLPTVFVTFAVVLLGLRGVEFARTGGAFAQQRWETKYPAVAAIVGSRTGANAVIFSGLHSGSLRYYAGRVTLNYYNLDPAWLEQAATWLNAHGAHPYALLESVELTDFKNRFSSDLGPGKVKMTPLLLYDGAAKIYFFDLAPSQGPAPQMETITDPSPEVRSVSPVTPPTLMLK